MHYLLATLCFLTACLHATASSASVALKGKILVENGEYYLVLEAPLEENGQTISRVKIENPTPEMQSSAGSVVFAFGTRSASNFVVSRSFATNAPAPGAGPPVFNTTINQMPITNIFTENTTNITNNTLNVTINESAQVNNATINVNQASMPNSASFVGTWATSVDPGGLSASFGGIGLSFDMSCHMVMDLGEDGQASLTIGPAGGTLGDGVIGINILGQWFVGRCAQGKAVLVIRPREMFGQKRLTKIIDRDISFYILHATENSLVLADNEMRFVMSRR
jgi:hypothetical protein